LRKNYWLECGKVGWDQIKEKAKEMYADASQNNDKPFTLEHIWKVVRHDKKWSAY
jgi:hypothetical protein